MTIQIRNFAEKDLELLVVMLNAVDAVDRMEQGTSLPEKREFLATPGLFPEENMFVAENDGGRLVGMAGQRLVHQPGMDGFRNWLEVHPTHRGRGLEDRLLARLEQRAWERMAEDHQQEVYFSGAGHTADGEKLRAFERAGMHEIRRFWVMARPNLPNLPPVRFPEGFEWRVPKLGEDDDEVLDSMNDSFSEHFGFSPDTMEWYQHYVHSINYRPELTVLAWENGRNRIAGFCQIVVNEGENSRLGVKRGWIDILGVRREYRRRGLGEALIVQGMHNLRAAGLSEAVLACDSENTTNATALYFKTGFQVRKTTIVYDKSLREPAAEQRRELAKV